MALPELLGHEAAPGGAGARRTADELGRAFPGMRVDRLRRRAAAHRGRRPSPRSWSRPAAPSRVAAGGYRAVLLLDGERMLARESLRVGEDVPALVVERRRPRRRRRAVVLVGVGGALGDTPSRPGRQPDYARAELADRRALRFPPAVRIATLQGAPDAVDEALRRLPAERRAGSASREPRDARARSSASTTRTAPRSPRPARARSSGRRRHGASRSRAPRAAGASRCRCAPGSTIPSRSRNDRRPRADRIGACTTAARLRRQPRRRRPASRASSPAPHEIVAVVTREDAPLGRKRVLTPTPVADVAAEQLGLPGASRRTGSAPVDRRARRARRRPRRDRRLRRAGPRAAARAPRLGWINLHFSLLPRWRGAAPVQRALIAGDQETGAPCSSSSPSSTPGDVFAMRAASRSARNQTAGHLLEALADAGAALLAERRRRARGRHRAVARRSSGEPTLAPKLDPRRRPHRLDATPRARVDARIRGVTPEPGAFTDARRRAAQGARGRDRARRRRGSRPAPSRRAAAGSLVGTASDAARAAARCSRRARRAMAAADWWRGRPSADAPMVRRMTRRSVARRASSPRAASPTRCCARCARTTPTPTCCCRAASPRRGSAPADAGTRDRARPTARCGCAGYYDRVIVARRRPRPSTRSTRRCSTRCGSAPTSCSRCASPRTPPSTSRSSLVAPAGKGSAGLRQRRAAHADAVDARGVARARARRA